MPNVEELRKMILEEAYHLEYMIHLGSTKMYQDLKWLYLWDEMKKDVANFMA